VTSAGVTSGGVTYDGVTSGRAAEQNVTRVKRD
jgi:hypothetical protein